MFGRSSGKIDLPSVPAALARVIQVTNSSDSTADQLAGAVMLDQSLATKVLRLANSAFYGRSRKAETITEAVVTLGFASVRNLAASASVVDTLFPRQMFPGLSWQDMWIHSVTCAVSAEAIHSRTSGRGYGKDECAFVAGLLHDIGKLILARALPHRLTQIVEACRDYHFEMVAAETNLLSTNHAKIGGELAEQWEFPGRLVAGIACHHSPEIADDHEELARSVQAANLLAKRLSRNYLVGVAATEVSLKDVAEVAGIHQQDMGFVVDQVRQKLRECGDILSWGDHMPGAGSRRAA